MSIGSDEVSGNPNAALEDAMLGFIACIGASLPDVCSFGFTIGDSYVPFEPDDDEDCAEDEAACSQAWVRVAQVAPRTNNSGFDGECDLVLVAQLEVGVLRCFDIPENGEAPTATQTLVAGFQALSDMSALHRAAMACEVWDAIETGDWQPTGPNGGQYGGTWTFTVELPGNCLLDPP